MIVLRYCQAVVCHDAVAEHKRYSQQVTLKLDGVDKSRRMHHYCRYSELSANHAGRRCDMPCSESIVGQSWQRASARCECMRQMHGHMGRCNAELVWEERGKEGRGGWEVHQKSIAGGDEPSNWEILCGECNKLTF